MKYNRVTVERTFVDPQSYPLYRYIAIGRRGEATGGTALTAGRTPRRRHWLQSVRPRGGIPANRDTAQPACRHFRDIVVLKKNPTSPSVRRR